MINKKTIKCQHCNKVFFDIGQFECPFCYKNLNDNIFNSDIFSDIFGKNFSDIFKKNKKES